SKAPCLLEQVERALDLGTGLVQLLVVWQLTGSAAVGWDDRQAGLAVQCCAKCVRIVGLVGQDAAGPGALNQVACRPAIMPLALGDLEDQRQPESVDDQVNLGRQATTRPTDSLLRGPPFAPEASR